MLPFLALVALLQDPLAFAASTPIHVGPMAGRPVIADLNRDGKLDVVLACGTCCGSAADPASGHVVVLLGDGKGGLAPAEGSPYKVESSTRKVAVGDVDEDGALDVVAAAHDSDEVVVLLGDGRGGFGPSSQATFPLGASRRAHTHDVVLGDVDRDGHLDILATQANEHRVAILHGNGKGGFAAPSHVTIARHPYDAIELVDVNGDRRPDLVVPDLMSRAISVLLQDEHGKYGDVRELRDRQFKVADRPGYVAVADANEDGKPDIVATHDDVGLVALLLGDGKGGFAPAPQLPLELPSAVWGIAAADFDGDRHVDFAFGGASGATVTVVRGDGKGGLALAARCDAGRACNYVAAGDLDGDGRPDLVAASYGEGTVTVLLNRGMRPAPATKDG